MNSTPKDNSLNNPAQVYILPDGGGSAGTGLVWNSDYCFQAACMAPRHVQKNVIT